jgi:hypothetical protein
MKVRKYVLLPRLLLLAVRAPRDQRLAWDRYWSEVTRTGFDGEVLWDAGDQSELAESQSRGCTSRLTPTCPSWISAAVMAARLGRSRGTRHGCSD